MKIKKTVSEKSIAANRANAQKSTGPLCDAGKSNVKFNAVKHGLLTKVASFSSDEEKHDFEEFAASARRDSDARGALEEMLVEEIIASWWKIRKVQSLLLKDLDSRQEVSAAILNTLVNVSKETVPAISPQPEGLRTATTAGWEWGEVVLKIDGEQTDGNKKSTFPMPEKRGNVSVEAKLSNSSESLLRYERAWKTDLYRAINQLNYLKSMR